MKKKLILIIVFIIVLILFILKIDYKSLKFGNNISNKSADKIKENILNIESYFAEATITIISNKTENTYIVKQKYYKEDNLYSQEIIEPDSIKGTKFIYKNSTLSIKNTKLNLNKIYKNYKYIDSNDLSLVSFIEEFNNRDSKCYEKDNMLVLEIKLKDENKYRKYKKLYILKENGLPAKMEVQDVTQNTLIYILYNEIELNKLPKEDIK